MKEWCMIHWKSTIAIVVITLLILDNAVNNVIRAVCILSDRMGDENENKDD